MKLVNVNKFHNRIWECLCDCGNKINKSTGSLKAPDTRKHCGCLPRPKMKLQPRIDMVGKKFSRLRVIAPAGISRGNKGYRWLCKCDCGKKIIVIGIHLRTNNTKSCGCLKLEKSYEHDQTDETLTRRLLKTYLYNAKRRGVNFALTLKNFKKIIHSPCHYCSILPNKVLTRKDNADHGIRLIYNGIDRMDNFKGYTLKNSVPCCEICNRAKSTLTYEEFLQYLNRIKNKG